MNIIRKAEFVWSDRQQKYIPVSILSDNWTGSVALCKGASSAQEDLQKKQADFYDTLTSDYKTQFSNQAAILSALNKSLSPIIQAGPSQQGFSQAELNTLNSQAVQGTGQQYNNASKALREAQAAAGGGNVYLPSGVDEQNKAALAAAGANTASNQLLGIQQANYETGRNQYDKAVNALSGVASEYNPTGFAGVSNNSGSSAFDSATKVAEMNNAASPWNFVGGLIGGAVQGGLNAFTGGVGSTLAKNVMG